MLPEPLREAFGARPILFDGPGDTSLLTDLMARSMGDALPPRLVFGTLMRLGITTHQRYLAYLFAAMLIDDGASDDEILTWARLSGFEDPATLAAHWANKAAAPTALSTDEHPLLGASVICLALNPALSSGLHRAMGQTVTAEVAGACCDLLALQTALLAHVAQRAELPPKQDPFISPRLDRLDDLLGADFEPLGHFAGPPEDPTADGTSPSTIAHTLLECTPVGVIRLDRAGRIVYENPATREILGVPSDRPSPAMGMRLADLPNVRALHIEEDLEALLEGGQAFHRRRLNFTSLFGRRLTITVEGRPIIGGDGAAAGTVIVLSDITREADLETQLVRAQKLEIFGTLVSHVAHDLNNVLVGVRGHASLLLEQLADSPHRAMAVRLDAASARMAAVVDGLLALARPGDEPDSAVVECAALLHKTAELLGGLLPESVELRVEADEPAWCNMGAAHLQQVVMNICVNARDGILARSDDAPGLIEVALRSTESDVIIEVRDNGAGMDPITRAQVFDPLFTTKPAGEGTGLGMPVSQGLVRSYRGTIGCVSRAGHGTTFTVTLPRAEAPKRAAAETPRRSDPEPQPVLVVEDHDVVRDLCVQVLASSGYAVVVARNGQEALELSGSHRVACAVVDVGLPDMDGRRLAELLSPVPILLTSGNPPSIRTAAGGRPHRFLKKPYRIPDLLDAVQSLLRDAPAP